MRRTEASTPTIETRTGVTGAPLEPRVAAQARDEQREEHLDDVVERTHERDRRGPGLALAHLHLHLRKPQAAAERHERRLDLRVVVRVLAGEELDACAVEGD